MGGGIDRHLMGLYIVSEMSGITPKPSLFTDKAFQISKRFQITTSNISGGRGSSPIWGGFSAMFDDGYGTSFHICEIHRPGCQLHHHEDIYIMLMLNCRDMLRFAA